MREIGKALQVFGGALVLVGLLLTLGSKLPLRLGRLPGDIVWQGKNTTVHLPIVTCLLLSAILSLVLWLFAALKR
jgi:hypothetical protein